MALHYSVDFGEAGRLKDNQGLRRVLAHALRTQPDAEMKENVDVARSRLDRIWINPSCGKKDGTVPSLGAWTAPADLPASLWDNAASGAMAALEFGLGITRAKYLPGAPLLFGAGFGGKAKKKPKPKRLEPDASDEARRQAEEESAEKARRALRKDAVLVQNLVLQASPSFFFPQIAGWSEEQVAHSTFAERMEADPAYREWRDRRFGPGGVVDWSRVSWGEAPGMNWERAERFRQAATEWALERFGADRVLSVSLHVDETSPHVHVALVPFAQGTAGATLSAKKLIGAGADGCREMLDGMQSYFKPLGLERPVQGNPSTGEVYRDRNRRARARAEVAERRAEEAEAASRARIRAAGEAALEAEQACRTRVQDAERAALEAEAKAQAAEARERMALRNAQEAEARAAGAGAEAASRIRAKAGAVAMVAGGRARLQAEAEADRAAAAEDRAEAQRRLRGAGRMADILRAAAGPRARAAAAARQAALFGAVRGAGGAGGGCPAEPEPEDGGLRPGF